MNEHEPRSTGDARPAPDYDLPDWRRFEVSARRFTPYIEEGIGLALAAGTEINETTARCIAHVLGRAQGRTSPLADYGRTGEGNYLSLRDFYLDIYNDERATPEVKQWIDWLGTYLVQQENVGSGRRFMNEHQPPRLEQLLVRTHVSVGDESYTVNVPASWRSGDEEGLVDLLTDLRLPEDEALQAFLTLPDVNVGTNNLMESFQESFVRSYVFLEDAVRELAEIDSLEVAIYEAVEARSMPHGAVQIDYSVIEDQVRDAYDLIEWRGHIHVFHK